jgi:hypothetical protein
MSDPTVEELLEELQDLLAGIPPEARPVVIKMAMEHVLHRHEQLMPLAPSGVEKDARMLQNGSRSPLNVP